MDLHTNGLSQYILNDYLNDKNEYKKHLENLRKEYKNKMLVFKKYLDLYLPFFFIYRTKRWDVYLWRI